MPTRVRIGQSADPDDAFMSWALERLLTDQGLDVEITFADIESLNRAALAERTDLCAVSVGAYPALASRYRMLRCGASFGDDYGPVVVGREPPASPDAACLAGLRIAIPGAHTTAALLLRIFAGDSYEAVEMDFDAILGAVIEGSVDAGLVIHEGQMTYERLGLHALYEPAAEWARRERLPLPLGAVVVRRELPPELQDALAAAFGRAVHEAFEHPEEALDFAARYARGLDRPTLEEYVHRYVDAATLDMGTGGLRAVRRLFELARERGAVDALPELDLL